MPQDEVPIGCHPCTPDSRSLARQLLTHSMGTHDVCLFLNFEVLSMLYIHFFRNSVKDIVNKKNMERQDPHNGKRKLKIMSSQVCAKLIDY